MRDVFIGESYYDRCIILDYLYYQFFPSDISGSSLYRKKKRFIRFYLLLSLSSFFFFLNKTHQTFDYENFLSGYPRSHHRRMVIFYFAESTSPRSSTILTSSSSSPSSSLSFVFFLLPRERCGKTISPIVSIARAGEGMGREESFAQDVGKDIRGKNSGKEAEVIQQCHPSCCAGK